MKRQKLLFAVLVTLFVVVVAATVTTLSLSAIDISHITAGGNWEYVCCGKGCTGGIDACTGDGSYICCK